MRTRRPPGLYDREIEWNDLTTFATSATPKLRLGILYGRRRYGKSFLLRRLVEATGGLYHQALEQEQTPALNRFAAAAAGLYKTPPPLSFSDWDQALRHTVELLSNRDPNTPQVLVIDEYPYLRKASPEIDSTIQSLMDDAADNKLQRRGDASVSIVLCGSTMSVMTDVLSGSSPLRGRASFDLPLQAFDFRETRGFWGIDDHMTAFLLHSIVGGAAGYRDLTLSTPLPNSPESLLDWLAATVLNPSHALFREDSYLLREDPKVTKEALYYSLLNAISGGKTSPSLIAGAVGKKTTDITYHLDVMRNAGFVTKESDLLVDRRPVYRVNDPIVRFHELITRRYQDSLEDRKPEMVWNLAQDTFRSNIVGPHFESLCRIWTSRYASASTLGGKIGPVTSVQVNDPQTGGSELDVVAASEASQNRKTKTLQILGEAKGTQTPLTLQDLDKLEKAAAAIAKHKNASLSRNKKYLLFSMAGFAQDLENTAGLRDDLELIDLKRLYEGS